MATASWLTRRGYNGMCPPKFRPDSFIDRGVIAFPIVSYMAAVSHLELEFLSYWTTHEVHYAVRLPGQNLVSIRSSPSEILRFYDLTTPPFWVVRTPIKLWVVIKTPKKHNPRVRSSHISHNRLKSVEGCQLGASPRKKKV